MCYPLKPIATDPLPKGTPEEIFITSSIHRKEY
jgi:hypothetical protein